MTMQGEIRPGYKQTEVGVIPEDWEASNLGAGICLLSGHHVLARYCNATSGTPYITGPSDFASGHIQHTKYTTRPTTLCAADDILITVKGSGAGRMVVANAEYCISRQLMAIRPMKWDGLYLFYSLLQNSAAISAASTGLIPGLSRGDVTDQLLPIPSFLEQRAIAAALADADALIAALEGMIVKKRDLKQAAMQHLLTGKTRLPGFSGEWEVKRLGEVAFVFDGTHQTPSYVPSGIPFYSVEHVTSGDFSNTKFITPTEHKFLTRTVKIERGDILMTRIGSIGDCKLVDWEVDASFYVSLALLKIRPGTSARYIEQYSKTRDFQIEIEMNSLMQAIPKKINPGPISRLAIRLPSSLEEQTAIAEVLSDMDADLAALQARAAKARAVKQGMMQELLTGRVRLV